MAATSIQNTIMNYNTAVSMPMAAALHATDGAAVDFGAADQKIVLILQNGSAAEKTATIQAGNGIQGVKDLNITLAASETKFIHLESGRFMQMTGANKGKVLIKGTDATVKAACVVLP